MEIENEPLRRYGAIPRDRLNALIFLSSVFS